jgi:uncharacterized membrane protein YkvA (DUF1232 family)
MILPTVPPPEGRHSPNPIRRMQSGGARLLRQFRQRVALYRAVLAHPRTPRVAKWLLGLAIGYACLPFDLIPDWIPVLGLLDDLVILPLLVWLAIRAVPADVYEECARQVGEPSAGAGDDEHGSADH